MKAKRNGLLLSCVLFTALAASCYGPFNATRSLYKWNGEVTDSKWGNEAVFLGLAILPVYGIFMLGDAIIFNSLEFWGAKNPVDPPTAAASGTGAGADQPLQQAERDSRVAQAGAPEVAGS